MTMEKHKEYCKNVYLAIIDYQKAFYTVIHSFWNGWQYQSLTGGGVGWGGWRNLSASCIQDLSWCSVSPFSNKTDLTSGFQVLDNLKPLSRSKLKGYSSISMGSHTKRRWQPLNQCQDPCLLKPCCLCFLSVVRSPYRYLVWWKTKFISRNVGSTKYHATMGCHISAKQAG